MHLVFLADTYGEIVPIKKVDAWLGKLPMLPNDRVSMLYFDVIVSNADDAEYMREVMDLIESADVLIACGENSIGQLEAEGRRCVRMPDLITGKLNYTHLRSQLNLLRVVIDTIRANGLTY